MHLYFGTRGVKHMRDLFVTMMQSQPFPWKRKNLKTGKEETKAVQGALRPVELWEYVFPEDCLPEVLAMLGIIPGNRSAVPPYKLSWLRKLIGAKKIPKNIPVVPKSRMLLTESVGIFPIGIKYDEKRDYDFGEQGKYNQEGL